MNAPEDIAILSSQMGRYIARSNTMGETNRLTGYAFDNLLTINRTDVKVRRSIIGGVPWPMIVVLSSLTAFLLLLSCVNYMNIALATAGTRLREIGVRKAMGGLRSQIAWQFLTENLLLCLIALIMGIEIADAFLIPVFNEMAGVNLALDYGNLPDLTLFLLILLTGLGFASGAYPAFYLSSFQPASIFRQMRRTGGISGIMQGFLTIQFIVAFITVIAGVTFTMICNYQKTQDWGYNPAHTLVIQIQNPSHFSVLRDEALRLPGVLAVAGSVDHIGRSEREVEILFEDTKIEAFRFDASLDYEKTIGLRLKTGQWRNTANSLVVNEAFTRSQGWREPLGSTVRVDESDYVISGVVEDFHFENFQEIEPVVFGLANPSEYRFLSIHVQAGADERTESAMGDAFKRMEPFAPFRRFFQDTVFDKALAENERVNRLFTFTAGISLLIACLGLYGLASQNTADRLKEVGIRKVLGGSIPHLAWLIHRRFVLLLVLGAGIATPVTYLALNALIENLYTYRMAVGPAALSIAYGLVFLTVLLTISTQIQRLATVNPAEALRNE